MMQKKSLTALCLLVLALPAWAEPPTAPEAKTMWKAPYTVDGSTVTFQFDPVFYGRIPEDVASVTLRGSFTGWKEAGLALQQKGPNLWVGTFPLERVSVPGNSGQPEYKFVVNEGDWVSGSRQPEGWQFNGNFVLMLNGDTPEGLKAKLAINDLNRRQASDYANEGEMANFRVLTGGQLAPNRLYRSYHPFLKSKQFEVEKLRVQTAAALMEKAGIACVLNLTDTPEVIKAAMPSEYYKKLAEAGQVLFTETSYEQAYFSPQSPQFGKTLRDVLGFVAGHQGPYLVHCRLGTDRTGVITAVLEALAGVPWETIAADYQKSNQLGIKEYRDRGLLAWSFKMMLGEYPAKIPDLQKAMRSFLTAQGVAKADLEGAFRNLTTP